MANTQNTNNNQRPTIKLLKTLKLLIDIDGLIPKFEHYKYNYEYLKPLAMTNICEISKLEIPLFPKSESPSIEWLILLVLEIVKLYLWNTQNTLKDKINLNDESPQQTLEKITKFSEKFISNIKNNTIDKIKIAGEVVNFLKEIDQELSRYKEFEPIFESTAHQSPVQAKEIIKDLLGYYAKYLEIIKKTNQNSQNNDQLNQNLNTGLQEYDNLFNSVIKKPLISNYFQEDKYFAYMQVAGPNPLMLQQVKTQDQLLSITSEQYQQITAITMAASDSLEMALQEGRLYLADYSLLQDLRHGSYPQAQKYIYAPLALFAVPPASHSSRNLAPIAISCQEVLFTPLEQGTWMSAKSIVQMSDSNYHELISHLAHTHLFIEPFIVATHHLPVNHPVRQILLPHFQGTVLINYGAHRFLIAPGGGVDALLASTIQTEQKLAINTAQQKLLNFNNCALPDDLKNRGVDDINKLPIYPYRDDGLLIWNAIYNWIQAYFSCYYSSDSQVLNDINLQNWVTELTSEDGGRVYNFGESNKKIRTLDYLVKAITTIIFTASAQHAAVNFPQGDLMLYIPAIPLARYTSAPTTSHQEDNFINGLPPLDQAKGQIRLLSLLGSIYYTNLGNYNLADFPTTPGVQSALEDFQKDLQEIAKTIAERNENIEIRKALHYEYLLPLKIPQSINI
jgi:arachidonate 15-lipoxygenase